MSRDPNVELLRLMFLLELVLKNS